MREETSVRIHRTEPELYLNEEKITLTTMTPIDVLHRLCSNVRREPIDRIEPRLWTTHH